MKRREQISAWVLLSVFVPMLLLSYFHIHVIPAGSIDCDQCVENVHHAGHITQHTAHVDDCVLCRFMGQRFITAEDVQEPTVNVALVAIVDLQVSSTILDMQCGVPSLRAPPAIL
ncbi:MAG: hypothetical protein IJ775_00660 [Muribaculaceae bacterium]|nr:hypothetical protein [Muribaculaceae bacterium]